jgi:arginyl-tRNA synthetase
LGRVAGFECEHGACRRDSKKKGITEESQGATIVDLTKYLEFLGKAIVRKRDGTSIYLTRDIGGVVERAEKYKYVKISMS